VRPEETLLLICLRSVDVRADMAARVPNWFGSDKTVRAGLEAMYPARGLRELSMDDWRKSWDLKELVYIDVCRQFYSTTCDLGSGTILNVIDMAGRVNRAAHICGSAGNAALIAFANALRAEEQSANVRVLGLNPSPTLTDRLKGHMRRRTEFEFGDGERWEEMLDSTRYPFGHPAAPKEVAAAAVMLMLMLMLTWPWPLKLVLTLEVDSYC